MARSGNSREKVILALLAMGGVLAWRGYKRFRNARKVADTPTSRIATAAQGFVELQGYAWPTGPAFSTARNCDGLACVVLSFKIQVRRSNNNQSDWDTVHEIRFEPPFHLVDGTGAVLVNPSGFELHGNETNRAWKELDRSARSFMIAELQTAGCADLPPLDPGLFSRGYRCIETSVLVGSPVLAHGSLETRTRTRTSIEDERLMRFLQVMKANERLAPSQRISLMDLDKNGRIDEQEKARWAHGLAMRLIKGNTAGGAKGTPLPVVGALSPHAVTPSFLADCHESEYLERYAQFKNVGMLLLAGALVVAAVGLILGKWG